MVRVAIPRVEAKGSEYKAALSIGCFKIYNIEESAKNQSSTNLLRNNLILLIYRAKFLIDICNILYMFSDVSVSLSFILFLFSFLV